MTADDYYTALSGAAEERAPINAPNSAERLANAITRADFRAGAEWARTHLAAQEPTDADIEAAAEGMWDRYGTRGMWKHAPEHLRSAFLADARAALSAARAARRDEEKPPCGCDLTGPVPPAVHVVDRHEEKR